MNKIFINKEIMILSDKPVAVNDGDILIFADGSYVDIPSRKIVNKGNGQITIKDLPFWPAMTDILSNQQTFEGINHLVVEGDMNNIIIIPDEGENCVVSLGGADEFVQRVSICQQGDQLYIGTPRSNRNVQINMGSVWVNGKRVPPKIDKDFGYIEIKCHSLKSLCVNSGGTGEIYSQIPIFDIQAKIKGSTSIDAIQIENVNVEIFGSGDLTIDQLNGSLCGKICGSGSINIMNGEADNIDVAISGSGNVFAGIIVKKANLFLSGSGTIVVTNVVEEYIEQKTGSGFIKVLQKGQLTT